MMRPPHSRIPAHLSGMLVVVLSIVSSITGHGVLGSPHTLNGDRAAAPAPGASALHLPLTDGRVLVLPDDGRSPLLLLNPASGELRPIESVANRPGRGGTATRLADGRWLFWGGTDRDGEPSRAPVIFDPATEQLTRVGESTLQPRTGHTATLLPDGRVLVLGGHAPETPGRDTVDQFPLASGTLYDPVSGEIDLAPRVAPAPRTGHSAILLLDGRVLITGGRDVRGTLLATAEIWNPTTGMSTYLAGGEVLARERPALRLLSDGQVRVSGGTGSASAAGARIDILANTVTALSAAAVQQLAERVQSAPELSVTASRPRDGTADFPVDGTVGLRFGDPLDRASLEGQSVTLLGQEGEVPVTITLAESGDAMWVRPAAALFPAARYTLFLSGVRDAMGRSLPLITLSFSTTAYLLSSTGAQTSPVTEGDARIAHARTAHGTGHAGHVGGAGSPSITPSSVPVAPELRLTTGGRAAPSLDTHGDEAFVPTLRSPGRLWVTGRPLPDFVRRLRDNEPTVRALKVKAERHRLALTHVRKADLVPLTPADGIARVKVRGGTGVSGVVLKLNDQPLAGALVAVGHRHTRTDSAGRFTLRGLSPGKQELFIDGSGGEGRPYGQTLIGVDLEAAVINELTYGIYLPRIRSDDWIDLPAPVTRPISVTHPAMPGFELHLPEGTVLRDRHGKILTRIAITPVPLDRTPFPTPMRMSAYFNVQPAGIKVQGLSREASAGIRVAYANAASLRAGATADFWSYEPAGRGWYVYGTGGPSQDGRQVAPETGVGLYETLASGISLGSQPAAPTVGPPPGSCLTGAGDGSSGAGDPVDCATGLFLLQRTDLAVNDVLPLTVSRTYRPGDTVVRDFGKGASHPFALYLRSDATASQSGTVTLVLPDGGQVVYQKAAGTRGLYDGWFEHRGSPSPWYGSTVRLSNGVFRLALKSGDLLEFGAHGEGLIGIQDRLGRRIAILRQGGNIQRLTSPSGRTIDFSYDSFGRITGLVDSAGRRVAYAYDSAGYLARVTDAAGHTENYEYDADGRMTRVIDGRGQTQVTNQYDTRGRVIRQVLGDSPDDSLDVNATWRFTYTANPAGKVVRTVITDPQGVKRQLEFENGGYVKRARNALGTPLERVTLYERGLANHRVRAVVDPLGRRTEYGYDGNGNLIRLTRLAGTADAVTDTFTYTPDFNLLASTTDALARTRRYGYDTQGRLITLIDPLGQTTTLDYNGASQLTSVTDPNGHAVRFAYDLYDLYSVTDALGRTSRVLTDDLGRTLGTADALGNRTRYVYDAHSRITQVTDALNRITRLTYDAASNLTSFQDPAGSVTQWRYDALDRMIERTDPVGQVETFAHDPAGRLVAATDRGGHTTAYAYDALNRPTQASYTDGSTVSYDYDAVDRLVEVTDSVAGAIQRDYDGFDRLIKETTPQGAITYAYDNAHRRIRSQLNEQTAHTYAYDAADRLSSITRGTQVVSYAYDAGGRLTAKTLPNRITARFDYDDGDQLRAIRYARGTTDLGDITYQYDAAGRRIQQGGSLTVATLPEAVADAAYDPLNRLVTRDGDAFDYDPDGHLLSDGRRGYQWDARGRLVGIANANGAVLARFAYDAFDRRIEKTVGGQVTRYLHDGLNPVQELTGANTVKANLFTGLGVDEFISRFEGTTARHYLTDALGSTIALADPAGTIRTRYAYDAFGNTTASGDASSNRFQYTGRENDGTGLYYYRARYYHPATQRFISEDPLGLAAGDANLYAYVGNDPIQNTDSSGLILDTLVDAGFILYDLYHLAADGACGRDANLAALGLDIVGAIAPGVTGLGAAARRAKAGSEVVQRAMSRAELEAMQATGLVRGGRSGTHYVSDGVNSDPLRTRQRLALGQTPEVRVTMEVPAGTFSRPSRVQPLNNMPGGGMERTATGNIPASILRIDEY